MLEKKTLVHLCCFLYRPLEFASWMLGLQRYISWLFLLPHSPPVAKCEPPPDISNGKHNGEDEDFYTYGSSVTYRCDPNFSMIGKASISCTVENKTIGVWRPSPPTCKSKSQWWTLVWMVCWKEEGEFGGGRRMIPRLIIARMQSFIGSTDIYVRCLSVQ